uniref:Uncharacterized protein n=1 Tax=Catharus ustulatus TaxID=91951 RepID=A0A8C3V3S1_CATUS
WQHPSTPPPSLTRLTFSTHSPIQACPHLSSLIHHHPCLCNTTFLWDSLHLLQAVAATTSRHPFPSPKPSSTPTAAADTTHCILPKFFITLSSPNTPAHHHWDAKIWHCILHHIQQLEQYVPASSILFEGQGPCNLLLSIKKYLGCIQDFLSHTCFHLHNHTHIMCD